MLKKQITPTKGPNNSTSFIHSTILKQTNGQLEITDWFVRFVESLNDGFAMMDSQFCFVYVNTNFSQLLGRKQKDIIGKPAAEFLDKENRNVLNEQRKLRQQGRVDTYELSLSIKKQQRYIRVAPTPLIDESGHLLATFAIIIDITQAKTKEKSLVKAHAELEQLVLERTAEIARKSIAVQELLGQMELGKKQYATRVTSNIETILLPMIKAAKGISHSFEKKVLDVLEQQVLNLTSPLGDKLGNTKLNLTPREIQICNLIRNGFTGKEISELIHVSPGTIEAHRNKIRKKLGLISSKKNLAIALRSL